MRKVQLMVATALLALCSATLMAQEPPPGGGMRQGGGQGGAQMMQRMMQGITLSAEQQAKVDSIVKKYQDLGAAMRQDQSMDRDTRMAKMRENNTKRNDEIKAVLTDEQKKVFEKNLADMQAQMQRPPTE